MMISIQATVAEQDLVSFPLQGGLTTTISKAGGHFGKRCIPAGTPKFDAPTSKTRIKEPKSRSVRQNLGSHKSLDSIPKPAGFGIESISRDSLSVLSRHTGEINAMFRCVNNKRSGLGERDMLRLVDAIRWFIHQNELTGFRGVSHSHERSSSS
ncbi:hypothetical protein HPB51_020622 [Rhipicephalus microplus]|uniref:Uncharacterized protein n=1 Tax=Rhipicephalus microplus TaxID=6941 RepID=A0A9J6DIG2_RHIMP|nr:hypothetical protein HPB51_020622 [Rhipicephalus microplus]